MFIGSEDLYANQVTGSRPDWVECSRGTMKSSLITLANHSQKDFMLAMAAETESAEAGSILLALYKIK